MLEELWHGFEDLLALESDVADVGVVPMALRTLIVYIFAVAIVRIGSKRFLSKATPFDVLVAVMLGSVVSRAINGSAPFVPTLIGAAAVLIVLHWLLATLSFHWDWFGPLIKGRPKELITDGEIRWDEMRRAGLSDRDLNEVLRLQGYPPDPTAIQSAHLERNGDISIVAKKGTPRTVDVSVREGVQTVRIELDG